MDRDAYGARGRADLAGQKDIPTTRAPYQEFTPIIDTFLKEHLFADIFARDVLTHQQRELATIAALANMTGTEGQLFFHFGAAMNTGLTTAQMHEFIRVLDTKVDTKLARSARVVLTTVLAQRGTEAPHAPRPPALLHPTHRTDAGGGRTSGRRRHSPAPSPKPLRSYAHLR